MVAAKRPRKGAAHDSADTRPTKRVSTNASKLIEELEAQEAAATNQVPSRRTRSVDEMVSKQLRDHFPGWGVAQTDTLLNKEGRSLREVLTQGRQAILVKDPGAPTLGKKYYEKLMTEFSYSQSPFKRLQVQNSAEEIDPDLLDGLEAVNSHPKSFEKVLDFLDRGGKANQRSLVLLYRQCLKFSPQGNNDVLAFLLAALKYSHKHRVCESHSVEWSLVKPHFDEALVRSLSQWKSAGLPLRLWWDSVKDSIGDIVPTESFGQCLAQEKDWSEVEVALCRVVQSSSVGSRAFGLAWRQLQSTKVTSIISTVLAKLPLEKITKGRLEMLRNEFMALVKSSGRDPKEVLQKRDTVVTYRGAPVSILVHSYWDEYQMHECALVEGLAVDNDQAQELFVESELLPRDRRVQKVEFDESVLVEVVLARRAAAECLDGGVVTGDGIVSALEKKGHVLLQLSKGWRVQAAFWKSVTGASAETRLLTEVLLCLPDEGRTMTIGTSLARLDILGKSRLVQFCGLGLQAVFSTAKQFIMDLKNRKTPKYDGKHDSHFMVKVMSAAGRFLTHVPPGGSGDSPTLYGKFAAEYKFKDIQRVMDTDGGKTTLDALGEILIYGWLLTEQQRATMVKWTDELVKADVVAAAASASDVMKSETPSKPKAGRKKVAPSARDMVLNLLE